MVKCPLEARIKNHPSYSVPTAPADLVRKFTVKIFPAVPEYPGLRIIPSKDIVPALLEKEGSCAQRLKIEPDFEIETTSTLLCGKEISLEAAFIASSEET